MRLLLCAVGYTPMRFLFSRLQYNGFQPSVESTAYKAAYAIQPQQLRYS